MTKNFGYGLVGAALACGLLVFLRPDWLSAYDAALAATPIFICLIAWLCFVLRLDSAQVPFIQVSLTYYAIAFGAPVFFFDYLFGRQFYNYNDGKYRFFDIVYNAPSEITNTTALVVLAAGSIFLAISYAVSVYIFTDRTPVVKFRGFEEGSATYILAWLLLISHVAYFISPTLHNIPSIGQLLLPAGFFAFGLFYVLWRQGVLTKPQTLAVVFIAIPIEIFLQVSSAKLTTIMFFGIYIFLLRYLFVRNFPWHIALIFGIILVLLYPAMSGLRAFTWNGTQSTTSAINKIGALPAGIAIGYGNAYSMEAVKIGASAFLRRSAAVIPFSHIVSETPEKVPYWSGETFRPLLTSFIPRFLWPDKPEDRLGDQVRERFKFVRDGSPNKSSIKLPWIAEFYANFGPMGVVVGMLICGVVLMLLSHMLVSARAGPGSNAIGLAVITPLVFPESNVSNMTGSILPLTFAIFIIGAAWAFFVTRFSAYAANYLKEAWRSFEVALLSCTAADVKHVLFVGIPPSLLLLLKPDWLELHLALLATTPIIVALLSWVLFWRVPGPSRLPLFEVTATFYGLTFGLPVFLLGFSFEHASGFQSLGDRHFRFMDLRFYSPEDVFDELALILSALGSCVFLVSYRVMVQYFQCRVSGLPFQTAKIPFGLLRFIAWSGVVGHQLALFFPGILGIPSVGQLLLVSGFIGFGILFSLWYANKLNRTEFLLLVFIVIPIELWLNLGAGALTKVLMIGLFVFFIVYSVKERFPIKIALITAVFLLSLHPALGVFRSLTWEEHRASDERATNSFAYLPALAETYSGLSFETIFVRSVANYVQRGGLVILFSHVTRQTPDPVPHWNGATYKPLLTSMIPRAVWPNKPREELGAKVRDRYAFVEDPVGNPSSINFPWMVEMYANFGSLGVVIGMALNGVLMFIISTLYCNRTDSPLNVAIGTALVFPLVFQESNFSNMIGSLLPFTILILIGFWFLSKLFNHRALDESK